MFKKLLTLAVFASLLAQVSCARLLRADPGDHPNVVMILTDDLNDYLGVYRAHPLAKTPNIDKLASRAMLFRNAYCQIPHCAASRNSFMSGLYPDQTKLYTLTQLLRETHPNAVTLPQYFQQHGYKSARVGKIYHYMNPKDIGTNGHDDPASWDVRINPKGRDKDVEADGLIESINGKQGFGARLSWYADPIGRDEDHTDGMVATESIKLMQRFVDTKEPFFLGVGFYKPHTPYVAPKKYFDLYSLDDIVVPTVPDGYLETIPAPAKDTLLRQKEERGLTEAKAKKSIQAYLATISFMDAQVGRVLDAIDAAGQRDNTIVLFTSDHGYHMGEHLHFQKQTLFEEAARVPLIIAAPGMMHPGSETDSLAELIDMYPTLADLAGLPKPDKIAGVSLVPVLNDPSATVRDSALTQLVIMGDGYSIRTPRYRFTRWMKGDKRMTELYDWQNDPDEMNNLAEDPQYKKLHAKMNRIWEARVEAAGEVPEGVEIRK